MEIPFQKKSLTSFYEFGKVMAKRIRKGHMKTYLSIDLDFWNDSMDEKQMRAFLLRAKEVSKGRLHIVDSHESLRKYVGKSGSEHLINVDFHADIWDRFNPKFPVSLRRNYNCGTWVNFVKPSSRLLYTWIHPHSDKMLYRGYCSHDINPFQEDGWKLAGWRMAEMVKTNDPMKHIPWGDVVEVGIAMSYDWVGVSSKGRGDGNELWYQTVVEMAREIFGRGNIPDRDKHARLG